MQQEPNQIQLVNTLLERWQAGDLAARDELLTILHHKVEKIASIILRRNQAPLSFVTSELANEAFLKLLMGHHIQIHDQSHLLALCAKMMRCIVVDKTRQKLSQKHKGESVTLCTEQGANEDAELPALELDSALNRLSDINPDRAMIVEMRYFGGMTFDEIAIVLKKSPSTVKRSWRATRGWLKDALEYDAA